MALLLIQPRSPWMHQKSASLPDTPITSVQSPILGKQVTVSSLLVTLDLRVSVTPNIPSLSLLWLQAILPSNQTCHVQIRSAWSPARVLLTACKTYTRAAGDSNYKMSLIYSMGVASVPSRKAPEEGEGSTCWVAQCLCAHRLALWMPGAQTEQQSRIFEAVNLCWHICWTLTFAIAYHIEADIFINMAYTF